MPKGDPFIEIKPFNFDELAEKYRQAPEMVYVALNEALRKAGRLLTPRIKAATPRGASRRLANTTVFQVLGKKEDQRMEIRQSAFSPSGFPYGIAVRTGTKPHFPPIDALVPWVKAVLNVDPAEVRQVAFLVARKISRVGTKANPYHLKVWNASENEVMDIMERAMIEFTEHIHDLPVVPG